MPTIRVADILLQKKLLLKFGSQRMQSKMSTIIFKEATSKLIAIIRHGQTDMNVHLHNQVWGAPGFIDPNFVDTRLTQLGARQAKKLNENINDNVHGYGELAKADLLISSPLTRALQTSELVFNGTTFFPANLTSCASQPKKKVVQPLATERLYLSSDIGRSHEELEAEFPLWDYDLLEPSNIWWYHHTDFNLSENGTEVQSLDQPPYVEWRPDGKYVCAGEPAAVFRNRMKKLRQWLYDRPEPLIVLTCHWGVARALTGKELENCEVVRMKREDLLEFPVIDE